MSNGSAAFGALLRQLRTATSLSQEALAERAGLSVRGISDLERGVRHAPRLETVRMLADALALAERDRSALLAAARPSVLRDQADAHEHSTAVALPLLLTRLIGREREVQSLQQALQRDGIRLLTLTGPGGTGRRG